MPSRARYRPARWNPWPHGLAWATLVATAGLILAGGLVTNTGSGLAVPDWPTTFGENMFLFPWSRMVGGILYEHVHRLLGALVGLLTVATAVALFAAEARPLVRTLGAVAVAVVVLQGVLGGLRVVLLQQTLAMLHGAIAPAFLALLATLVLTTSRGWQADALAWRPPPLGLRRLATATVAVVYLQVLLGVVVTHAARLVDAHIAVALAVSALILRLAWRARGVPVVRAAARSVVVLWALQVSLGLAAYVMTFVLRVPPQGLALLWPLAHRLTGALLLSAVTVLTVRAARAAASTAEARLPDGVAA